MIPPILTLSSPPTLSLSSPFLPPSLLPNLNHTDGYGRKLLNQKLKKVQRLRRGICKAELHQDAPFAIAISASLLNSLMFPIAGVSSSEDEDAAMSSSDARFSIMTIISLIPFFNWLSWVFALMDTGKRRYAVYAAVYLAPYLRTNLSLSPEESWLPIASIVLCIIHIQLEASIYSGDFDGFKIIHEAAKRLGLGENLSHVDDVQKMSKEARSHGNKKLPLGNQSRDEIQKWRVPRKHSQDLEHVDGEGDQDDRKQH